MTNNEKKKFLESMSEEFLCECVLMELFTRMGYLEPRYTHGTLETGRDIVFHENHNMCGPLYSAVVVKVGKIVGSVDKTNGLRSILYQIQQCFDTTHSSVQDGKEVMIHRVYFVTNSSIKATALESLVGALKANRDRFQIIDGVKLLSLCDEHAPDLLSALGTPEARYLHQMMLKFQNESLLYGAEGVRISISDVYTENSISNIDLPTARRITFALPEQTPSLESSLHERAFSGNQTILVADVGAGKTTSLKHLVISMAKLSMDTVDGNKLTPLFVDLSRIQDVDLTSLSAFKKFVFSTAEKEIAVANQEDKIPVVLLFDGYDENPARMQEISLRISEITKLVESVVVATRPTAIPDKLHLQDQFAIYRVLPFSDSKIQIFISRWFSAQPAVKEALWNKIQSSVELLKFCRTPLMLTLYCLLAWSTTNQEGSALSPCDSVNNLPIRRTDIYTKIAEYLLGKWDHAKGIRNNFSYETKQHFLETLARFLMNAEAREISLREALEIADGCLKDRRENRKSNDLINEIIYRSALLHWRPGAKDILIFTHHSFQEFLSAGHLARNDNHRFLEKIMFNDWWRGALVFYFGTKRSIGNIVSIQKHVKNSSSILRLFEYYVEADFSSHEQQEKILDLVGQVVFSGGIIDDSDVQILQTFGSSIAEKLIELRLKKDHHFYSSPGFNLAENKPFNVGSYFYVLASIGDATAWKELCDMEAYLEALDPVVLLRLAAAGFESIGDPKNLTWFNTLENLLISKTEKYYRDFFHPMNVNALKVYKFSDDGLVNSICKKMDNRIDFLQRKFPRESVFGDLISFASKLIKKIYQIRDHDVRAKVERSSASINTAATEVSVFSSSRDEKKRISKPKLLTRMRSSKR